MNKTLEKVAAMSMVAAAMVATSCGTQKKAASENTNVSDAVVAYPDEAHEMDENYLILDDSQRAQVQKNNAFALKLFTETAKMQSTVISPLSVTYLMAMLANGADGETRQQIMSTIGASDADINAMNALYHSIMEKQSRLDKLMRLQQRISAEIMAERIGQETRVIIDRREGDWYVGRTEYSSPEVDPEVLVPVSERRLSRGCFYNAKITGAEEFDIYATVI